MPEHCKGLSLAHFRTLCHVNRYPATSLSALAEHLGSSLPTASRIVAGLVRRQLLARRGSRADRRCLALALTAAGRSVFDGAWSSTHRQMEAVLEKLSPQDRRTVAQAMNILRPLFGSAGLPNPLPQAPPSTGAPTRPTPPAQIRSQAKQSLLKTRRRLPKAVLAATPR